MAQFLFDFVVDWFPFFVLIALWVFFVFATNGSRKRMNEINEEKIGLYREIATSLRNIEEHLKDRKS